MNNRKSITVLVADDDTAILESTKLLLEMNDYTVITSTGSDVISLMKKHSPAIVILDMWMGQIDGRDLCKNIKADTTIATIPIIIVSASNEIEFTYAATGASDYIEKPFDIDELLIKLEKYSGQN